MHSIKIQLAFLALLFFIVAYNNQQAKSPADAPVTENKNAGTMNHDSQVSFAQKNTQAWGSQPPGNVAAHIAKDSINL